MKNRMENSVDPDETARWSRLIWIYTVCIDICVGLQSCKGETYFYFKKYNYYT